ncbi:MAG TPA: cytochrome c family protein [Caulobacteraceae bacterium]|nr:cytochrome c family protein [Caulobacteraceae bacterium]
MADKDLLWLVALLAALGACSKGGNASENEVPSAAAPPPAPAPLTDAQKKAALASLPAAYQHADLDNGEAQLAVCKSCHTFAQGAGNMTGPNLWGVFGRKAGTEPGFAYSDGLKNSGIVWTADTIDKWIANPRAVAPATKMTYIGMPDPKNRTDLVAYLKVITSPPPAG